MTQLRRITLALAVVVSTLTIASGEGILPSSQAAIDAIMSDFRAEGGAPAVSLAVVMDGTLAFSKGYGTTEPNGKLAATDRTLYRLASVSKMLTATAAMQLVESGALDLTAPVTDFCAAFPAHAPPITLHHLLCHQSGLRHWRSTSERLNRHVYATVAESLDPFKNDPLLFVPGTNEEYSTPGYNVVGCAIAGASGMPYKSYMQKYIFDAAAMTTARVGDAEGRAPGYQIGRDGPRAAREDDLSIKYPGGGLSGSVLDLAAFVEALYRGALVSKSALDSMWSAKTLADGTVTNKGYGCNLGEEKGRQVVWHIGGVTGYCGILYCYPKREAAVALLCNLEAQAVFPTASAVMDAALGE